MDHAQRSSRHAWACDRCRRQKLRVCPLPASSQGRLTKYAV
jgi:hypothetical protein